MDKHDHYNKSKYISKIPVIKQQLGNQDIHVYVDHKYKEYDLGDPEIKFITTGETFRINWILKFSKNKIYPYQRMSVNPVSVFCKKIYKPILPVPDLIHLFKIFY
jgi:hypothetical protein